jgi:hypothetical protein
VTIHTQTDAATETKAGEAQPSPGHASTLGDRILSTQTEVSRFDRWVEFIAAVVLSLATVATAWAGYQAALWGGDQTEHMTAANVASVRAAQQSNAALQTTSLHANLFVAWVTAISDEKQELADFLYARFPAELKTAADAWIATKPRQNPDAPASPFAMAEYQLPQNAKAAELQALADEELQLANAANEVSDRYVLLTVIFASVLFFGGVSGKFQSKQVDVAMLALAAIVFLVGVGILVTYPVQ